MAEDTNENTEKEVKNEENIEEVGKKKFSKKTIIQLFLILLLSGASITGGLIASIGVGGVGNLFLGSSD